MQRFTLKALPYPEYALAPLISERTVRIHHDKHQAAYAAKLNQLINNTRHAHDDLELIMFHTKGEHTERPEDQEQGRAEEPKTDKPPQHQRMLPFAQRAIN